MYDLALCAKRKNNFKNEPITVKSHMTHQNEEKHRFNWGCFNICYSLSPPKVGEFYITVGVMLNTSYQSLVPFQNIGPSSHYCIFITSNFSKTLKNED